MINNNFLCENCNRFAPEHELIAQRMPGEETTYIHRIECAESDMHQNRVLPSGPSFSLTDPTSTQLLRQTVHSEEDDLHHLAGDPAIYNLNHESHDNLENLQNENSPLPPPSYEEATTPNHVMPENSHQQIRTAAVGFLADRTFARETPSPAYADLSLRDSNSARNFNTLTNTTLHRVRGQAVDTIRDATLHRVRVQAVALIREATIQRQNTQHNSNDHDTN